MNKDKLKELIEFAKTTDLREIAWEKKGELIRIKRSEASIGMTPAADAAADADALSAVESAVPVEKMVIKSTMVGTFYRADSKNRPPLVVEGTLVSAGQPVGSVEAMKIMKDVIAPMDCKIVKALIDNGHAVEYGQALFEVAPVPEPDDV